MNHGIMTPAELAAHRQEELDHIRARREWIRQHNRARRAAHRHFPWPLLAVVAIVLVAVVVTLFA